MLNVDVIEGGYEPNDARIENVHFSVGPGELVAMIGANGAGKSTTIKAIMGQLPFFEGEAEIKKGLRYSFIPERPVFYEDLTLWEHIEFVAAVEELEKSEWEPLVHSWLSRFRLERVIHDLPGSFSKGMQQKSMLILAIMSKPSLWIIDEPFMGLDPSATKLLLETLQDERERGAGILMCTHVLDTAQRIADRFIIMSSGTVHVSGSLDEVLEACNVSSGTLYDCIPEGDL
ncbi:ABC transporter ATP-binding protein [Jeotgalibacillus campisalis]|uniref:Multidrug ABC transporter ATP-binding protein n=1 Tax=Jeotgalibacillus campisalis TaxID=220754 RepID=A0A0C2VBR6_9BACL|nr:ABC transporter ATP-binding protein [Jeotgalibacillus campisalis]KIL46392.1 multidrug ABC transporter ATP-binding protein [Jeotgalibacillus campisalis]